MRLTNRCSQARYNPGRSAQPAKFQSRQQLKFDTQLLTRKCFAQSEPDIISGVAAREAIRGITANRLNPTECFLCSRSRAWAVSDLPERGLVILQRFNSNCLCAA